MDFYQLSPSERKSHRSPHLTRLNAPLLSDRLNAIEALLRIYGTEGGGGHWGDMKDDRFLDALFDNLEHIAKTLTEDSFTNAFPRVMSALTVSIRAMAASVQGNAAGLDDEPTKRLLLERLTSACQIILAYLKTKHEFTTNIRKRSTLEDVVMFFVRCVTSHRRGDSFLTELADTPVTDITAYCLLVPGVADRFALQGPPLDGAIWLLENIMIVRRVQGRSTQTKFSDIGAALYPTCQSLMKTLPADKVAGRVVRLLPGAKSTHAVNLLQAIEVCVMTHVPLRLALLESSYPQDLLKKYWEEARSDQSRGDIKAYLDTVLDDFEQLFNFPEGLPAQETQAWLRALLRLSNDVDIPRFIAVAFLQNTEAPGVRNVGVTRSQVEQCQHILKTLFIGWKSKDVTLDILRLLVNVSSVQDELKPLWLDLLHCLQDLPDSNTHKAGAIKRWHAIAGYMKFNEAEAVDVVLRKNKVLHKGQTGCANYKCPLYGVETLRQMFVCKKCRKVLYCSPFCHEMDWETHANQCGNK